jgi:hypothetical protein
LRKKWKREQDKRRISEGKLKLFVTYLFFSGHVLSVAAVQQISSGVLNPVTRSPIYL